MASGRCSTSGFQANKKEVNDKLDNEYSDIKRKVEFETNDLRDKMQFDKKALVQKFEEVEDERQKETSPPSWRW